MKGSPRMLALALVAVLAPPAAGQDEGGTTPAPGAAEYRPQVEEYTVQQGDTLWDISARLVGSPWFWPRVWSYNPEITNPHWIYPGDIVRFRSSEEPLPHLTELAAKEEEVPQEPAPAIEPSRVEEVQGGAVEVVETRPKAARASRRRELVTLFLTPRELAESGTLTNSIADKILLAAGDEVFVTFPEGKRAASGERYMVYRTIQEVRHPITKGPYGFITQVTGFATVRATVDDVSRALLTETLVEVERGQLVAPIVKLPALEQTPSFAKVPVRGVIVAVEPSTSLAAERQIVFVDVGAASGLETGNTLAVFVSDDPLVGGDQALPSTQVARLMAVDVRQNATTCLVIDARQEISAGLPVRSVTR